MSSTIHIQNFSKRFGIKRVIDDLSFDVYQGEIFAFLGANGSGKTTTIRTLLGIYKPDSGILEINGKKYSSEMGYMLGYLPEERGLYQRAKVLETFLYFGQLKGLTTAESKKRALEYLERVGLSDKANSEIRKLSSGQQQKIQLGITVINKPELLILDEPTKGLDPLNRSLLLQILSEMNLSGTTIIFSTHQMEEAESIAQRMILIKDGRSRLHGKVQDIKAEFGDKSIRIEFTGKLVPNDIFTAEVNGIRAVLTPTGDFDSKAILQELLKQNIGLQKFEVSVPSLNEIFLKVSKDE